MLLSIIALLTGCGVFLIGMKMMSDGVSKSAGSGVKKMFSHLTGNKFLGIAIGAGATAIIQSSAATTVIVIGFVNAGVMALTEAVPIIMGANIGTTVTGLIVSLSSVKITLYISLLAFIGVILGFFKSEKLKFIGTILCGLGLLFIGLESMNSALSSNAELKGVFENLFGSVSFPLLLVLFGAIFTALIQSSSASVGLIIVLCGNGAVSVESAFFLVLGTNIGTCVTSIIASIGTGVNARRTAVIHLLIKTIGVTIFTVITWIFTSAIKNIMGAMFVNPEMQVAWFHVFFNIITTLILLPFTDKIVKLACLIVKDKEENRKVTKFIDKRFFTVPQTAIIQARREIENVLLTVEDNLDLAFNGLIEQDVKNTRLIKEREKDINILYREITAYLIKLSTALSSNADELTVGSFHHVIIDLERIGDHAVNFTEQTEDMIRENVEFSPDAKEELSKMYGKVKEMFKLTFSAFSNKDFEILPKVSETEAEVDGYQKQFGANHIARLNSGSCSVELGTYFFGVISELERIADHLVNVSFSIKNPTGQQ